MKEKYRDMQFEYYEGEAKKWSLDNNTTRDKVVGWFDKHNEWEDYEYLFKDTGELKDKVCLDFGCGPGRCLVKYHNRFKRIDGVDISPENLKRAKEYLTSEDLEPGLFYECNGLDLQNIPDNQYDLIISTICMQHICVHEIRYNYFKEFLRVLKPGGMISIQMGYGVNYIATLTTTYYENKYDAPYTNGGCDVKVDSYEQLRNDLEPIGFTNFRCYVRPTGAGDRHEYWIYFNATKPT